MVTVTAIPLIEGVKGGMLRPSKRCFEDAYLVISDPRIQEAVHNISDEVRHDDG